MSAEYYSFAGLQAFSLMSVEDSQYKERRFASTNLLGKVDMQKPENSTGFRGHFSPS